MFPHKPRELYGIVHLNTSSVFLSTCIQSNFLSAPPFSAYLNGTNLDERQIYFVNQIIEYIVHNGIMKDFSVLQETPFTDRGNIVELFGSDTASWLGIHKVIEQINRNAEAV